MDEKAENFFMEVEGFLAPARREILRMRLDGCSFGEIAVCFGISQNRVRKILKAIDKEVLEILSQRQNKEKKNKSATLLPADNYGKK